MLAQSRRRRRVSSASILIGGGGVDLEEGTTWPGRRDAEAREESTACPDKRRRHTALGGAALIGAEQSGFGSWWEGVSCKKIRATGGEVGGGKRKKTRSRWIWKGWLRL
jgi:hypothetical protein